MGADDWVAERHRRAHQRPRGRRWPRRLLIAAGVALVATAFLGFVVAAPIVRHVAEKQLGELLGRRVTVARVQVNPFALSLTIEGLQVFEADGRTPFLGFSRLYVNVDAVSLFRRCLVVREVRLESLRGRVVREKGNDELAGVRRRLQLLGHRGPAFAADEASQAPRAGRGISARRVPRFSFSNIQIIDGARDVRGSPNGHPARDRGPLPGGPVAVHLAGRHRAVRQSRR